MFIDIYAFGGFEGHFSTELNNVAAPNGFGKTTIINAYVFALTGKTLSGFLARNVNACEDADTQVILRGFGPFGVIRRTLTAKSTQLYVDGDAMTQTDFEAFATQSNIDIPFCASLANVNALTDPSMTSEQLRRFLSATGVYDGGEAAALRAQIKKARADLKQAEQFALTLVTVPPRTVEPLTISERLFAEKYEAALITSNNGVHEACPTCHRPYPDDVMRERRQKVTDADLLVTTGKEEYMRIADKRNAYSKETQDIQQAEYIVQSAKRAREDVVRLRDEIATLETSARLADERAIAAELPDGVEMRTGGRAQIELYYNGVPLKSVNRGKRIELCVRMMVTARDNRGLTYTAPILVDNAESVQGIDEVVNLITFKVN